MIRKSVRFTITFAILVVALLPAGRAQDLQPNIDTAISRIRATMQADRDSVIGKTMALNDKDAAAFWPIYRKYEHERSILDDRRAAVIKQYSLKYPNFTDADAKDMVGSMLECESGIAALKKKYFKELNKVLPALTVAKFFQMDHEVDLVMDINVETLLPPLAPPEDAM